MKKNFVQLEGNVGFSPRVTSLKNGTSVMEFSVATNERFKNKAGEVTEETMWHHIIVWNSNIIAENAKIEKGTRLVLEGKLRPVHYTTKTGKEVNSYEVIAKKITVL